MAKDTRKAQAALNKCLVIFVDDYRWNASPVENRAAGTLPGRRRLASMPLSRESDLPGSSPPRQRADPCGEPFRGPAVEPQRPEDRPRRPPPMPVVPSGCDPLSWAMAKRPCLVLWRALPRVPAMEVTLGDHGHDQGRCLCFVRGGRRRGSSRLPSGDTTRDTPENQQE